MPYKRFVFAILLLAASVVSAADPSFVAPPSIVFDANPRSVAVADLDGDGDDDMAMVAIDHDFLYVLLQDGGFTTSAIEIPDSSTRSVIAADFNGDTVPDLALAGHGSRTIYVLLNGGDGTFGAPSPSGITYAPYLLRAAHFDGDGILDLAVAAIDPDTELSTLSILLGDGAGAFTLSVELSAGDFDLGDFDSDGDADLAAGVADPTGLQIFLGNGDGTFTEGERRDVGASPNAGFVVQVIAADLNNDAVPDLVTRPLLEGEHVAVLLGSGDGTFGPVTTMDTVTITAQMLAHDLTLDGNVDLVLTSTEREHVAILLGDGTGGFAPAVHYSGFSGPLQTAAGDLDGDAIPDLAVANPRANAIVLLSGDGTGAFEDAVAQPVVAASPESVATADFNGDDHLDLAAAGDGTVSVVYGDGLGAFSGRTDWIAGTSLRSVVTGDLNEDGNHDIAVARLDPLPRGIAVLFGDGSGSFAPPQILTADAPLSVTVADFNDDGRNDLAAYTVVNFVRGVNVFLNTGGGTFAAPVHYSSGPNNSRHVIAADLNADGAVDLITANHSPASSVSLLFGQGDGTFSAPVILPFGNSHAAVHADAGDVDADGDLDLVTASNGGATVAVTLGNGDGTFAPPTYFFSGQGSAVAIEDFDGDGHADLAVTNSAENTVSVLSGDGAGNFSDPITFPVGLAPALMTTGDFREDGRPDVAVTSSKMLTLLLNDSGGDNTPAGTNVSVQLDDVTLTFAQVDTAGTTTSTVSSEGPAPPTGFSLGDPPTYFDLQTTASFSGTVTICIAYASLGFTDESQLTLWHYEDDQWTDVTTTLDMDNDVICGEVTSLSPFAVLQREAPACPLVTLDAAEVRVGRKNHQGSGTTLDLRARVYKNGTLVGSGQVDGAAAGGPGYANALTHTIPLAASTRVCAGDTLSFELSVRNACTGAARLWYNTPATRAGDYFLLSGFALGETPPTEPKLTSDVTACSSFESFGTWSTSF